MRESLVNEGPGTGFAYSNLMPRVGTLLAILFPRKGEQNVNVEELYSPVLMKSKA